jgi:hypothetical protein
VERFRLKFQESHLSHSDCSSDMVAISSGGESRSSHAALPAAFARIRRSTSTSIKTPEMWRTRGECVADLWILSSRSKSRQACWTDQETLDALENESHCRRRVKGQARGNPASWPGEMRCGSVQDLGHPVVVDRHAADHQVLSLHYREALAREQPPGELAGLGEQARYSLLAGRRLHGVIQP